MIKIITIIENEDKDKTYKVFLNNFESNGSEIKVDRANVELDIITNYEPFGGYMAKINLEVNCLANNQGELFRTYHPKYDISHASDEELLTELKKRNVLVEEKVYKIN